MLVQALAAFADHHLADQLDDAAFETKPVPLSLEISANGKFLGWVAREQSVLRGKKMVVQPLPSQVPKSPVNRNSGVHPLLAYDEAKYVFGVGHWTKPHQEDDHAAKHAAFIQLLREAAEATEEEALAACVLFYDQPSEVSSARETLNPNTISGILFSVASLGPAVLRPKARQFWREHYQKKFHHRNLSGGVGMCLVSGQTGPIAPTHDKIKGAASLGGQAAGVALMSFDKDAFQSYGWDGCSNSPVSPDRAQAYVLALNALLSSRNQHRIDHQGVAYLFWLRTPPSEFDAMAVLEEADPQQVHRLLTLQQNAWVGLTPNEFYLLAVSGNGGRLVVKHWFHETLQKILSNVADWFQGLSVLDCFTGALAPPPKMWQLLAVTSRADPSPGRALACTRRALLGEPLGMDLLAALLARLRVEKGTAKLNANRIGLLKLTVNDALKRIAPGEPMMDSALNPADSNSAYLCGRLLAMFDSLQYESTNQDVNVTVADRYYSLASTFPQLAFPKLEDLGMKHLAKMRRSKADAKKAAAYAIERRMDQLRLLIGTQFPGPLSLVDQGRFALGFHHQRADNRRRAVEAKESKKEQHNEQSN
jgi:CRISPR-associated protein Csd1